MVVEGESPQFEPAVEFHPDAHAEMLEAARYYERQRSGLGQALISEVERAVALAVRNPAAGKPLGEAYRWVLTRRFRYGVIYRQTERGIEIIAVAHLRRRPGFWRRRT